MLLVLTTKIFQNFVQAGAKMNLARRIRRPVVEDEERLALPRFQNALVEVRVLPGNELFRLVLRQGSPSSESRFSAG